MELKRGIDADVALVVVDGVGRQRGVVVAEWISRDVGRGKRSQYAFGEGGDGGIVEGNDAVGVGLASEGIDAAEQGSRLLAAALPERKVYPPLASASALVPF